MSTLKVFIADGHQMFIDGLKNLINAQSDMKVIGELLAIGYFDYFRLCFLFEKIFSGESFRHFMDKNLAFSLEKH